MNQAYQIARNLEKVVFEVAGPKDNYFILWCLSICDVPEPLHDEIPWCSAGMNGVCLLGKCERSKSAMARSWMTVGVEVKWEEAQEGDIVVMKRGGKDEPGREVKNAPGHVCFWVKRLSPTLFVGYGGNQKDKFCEMPFDKERILTIRRV